MMTIKIKKYFGLLVIIIFIILSFAPLCQSTSEIYKVEISTEDDEVIIQSQDAIVTCSSFGIGKKDVG